MQLDLPDDWSTLVQLMAWCRQATRHNMKHYWPGSMPPYWRHKKTISGSSSSFMLFTTRRDAVDVEYN